MINLGRNIVLMLVGVVMVALGCEDKQAQPLSSQHSQSSQPSKSSLSSSPALSWATILDQDPDLQVVTDAEFLKRIKATGLPWRVADKSTGIEMLLVPPGKFMMGASPGDSHAQKRESPMHEVTISRAFYLGRTEVTQAQWFKVMDANPSRFIGDTLPVEQVSFNDTDVFLKKSGSGLVLPTEAQWEYACRAGTKEEVYGDLDLIAWHSNTSKQTTHAVGKALPNTLGFHDTLGNVWEWCQDWYGPYAPGSVTDPTGPTTGSDHLLRGGCWYDDSSVCRASERFVAASVGVSLGSVGFRVARTP